MRATLALILTLAVVLTWSAIAPGAITQQRKPLRADSPRVEIEDFAFHPQALTVQRGTTVVFANRDGTAHTVTKRGSFNTGRIRPGRSAALRFSRRGTFAYHCMIHPFMHGKVVVR
jgi:plastocyanin